MKPSLFSRKFWFGAFVAVLSAEFFSLLDEKIIGKNYLDPLSQVVIDQSWGNPETFGTGIVLVLCWLIFHWVAWPIIRKVRNK